MNGKNGVQTKKNRIMRFFPWLSISVLGLANLLVFGFVLSRFLK